MKYNSKHLILFDKKSLHWLSLKNILLGIHVKRSQRRLCSALSNIHDGNSSPKLFSQNIHRYLTKKYALFNFAIFFFFFHLARCYEKLSLSCFISIFQSAINLLITLHLFSRRSHTRLLCKKCSWKLQNRYMLVNFGKFSKAPFLKSIYENLLLPFEMLKCNTNMNFQTVKLSKSSSNCLWLLIRIFTVSF